MSKILHNYFRNFIKNWVETFGFLIFIIMLFCSLIGIISSPLQIYIEKTKISQSTTLPDYTVQLNSSKLNNYIIYKEVYTCDYEYTYDKVSENNKDSFLTNEAYKSIFLMTYSNYYAWDTYNDNGCDYNKLDALEKFYDDNSTKKPLLVDDNNFYDLSDWNNSDPSTCVVNEDKILTVSSSRIPTVASYIDNIFDVYANKTNLTSIKDFSIDTDAKTIQTTFYNTSDLINPNNAVIQMISQKKYYDNLYLYIEKLCIDHYQEENGTTDFNLNTELSWDYTYTDKNWMLTVVSSDYNYGNIFSDEANNKNYDTDDLVITSGRKPVYNIKGDKEIVLSSAFAKINNIKIGDYFKMNYSSYGEENFKVVGFGEKYSYLYPENYNFVSKEFSDTGYAYMPSELMSDIYQSEIDNSFSSSKISNFNYKLNINSNNDKDVTKLFTLNTTPLFNKTSDSLVGYTSTDNYTQIKMQVIQMIVYFILAIVIILLAFIFINFIIKKELNQTRKQIGIFKASGYKISELAWVFTLKEYFSVLIGILLGWLFSFPIQKYVCNNWQQQTTVYLQPIAYGWLYLSIIFIFIPLLIGVISFAMNFSYLKENIISLINNPKKVKIKKSTKTNARKLTSSNMKLFSFKLMNSFTKQSVGKFIVINILMLFTCLITFLELSALDVLKQTINSAYVNYNDSFKSKYYIESDGVTKIEYNNGTFVTTNNDSEVQFIDYSSTDNGSADSLINYINKNKTSSTLFANNYQTLLQTISDYVESEPSALFMPSTIDEIKSTVVSGVKPAIVTLLFTDLTKDDSSYYKDYTKMYSDAENNVIALANKIISGDTDQVDLSSTIFGATANDSNTNLFNFIYLKDITRTLMTLIYSNEVMQYIYDEKMDTTNINLLRDEVDDHFTGGNKININDQSKWELNFNNSSGQTSFINSLEPALFATIYSAMSVDTNESYNPLMTLNQVYYSSKDEALAYSIDFTTNEITSNGRIELYDFHSLFSKDQFNLGDPRNIYNLDGIDKSTFSKLTQVNDDGSVNVIISSLDQKLANLNIGDEYSVQLDEVNSIKVKVCGIAKKMTFSHNMFGDYKTFMLNNTNANLGYDKKNDYYYINDDSLKVGENNTTDIINRLPINSLFSDKEMYGGDVDIQNISQTISSLKYEAPNFSWSVKDNSSIMGSLIYKSLKTNTLFNELLKSTNLQMDKDSNTIINPSFLDQTGTDGNGISYSISITKKFMSSLSSKATVIIYLFIALSTVLIVIILSVVMNIIIDESIQVILTLKALGYRKSQINIIVLGNYIIAGLILFAVSWITNVAIWVIACKIIWQKAQILISVPMGIVPPIFNFCLVTGILIIGYTACDFKNRQYPITKIFD